MEMHLDMSQNNTNGKGWRGTNEGEKMKSNSGWNNNGNEQSTIDLVTRHLAVLT